MVRKKERLQILLPVYNEASSIERVIKEIYHELSETVIVSFIISEDGSDDGTPDIIRRIASKYKINLISTPKRKGYAKAIIDGFKKVSTPYVLCLDSDGQCDPKDFRMFWKKKDDYDVVIGWRKKRADVLQRKILSWGFKSIYKLLFGVKVHDPSCPFLLIKKQVLKKLIANLGILREGFWWEFVARATCQGFAIKEIPVTHRERFDGETRVYSLQKLPQIAYTHILGIFTMFWEQKIHR